MQSILLYTGAAWILLIVFYEIESYLLRKRLKQE